LVASGGSSAYCSFANCVFINTVATSAQGPVLDLTGLANFTVDSCSILQTGTSSAWAVAVQLGAGSSGLFRNNWITTQGAGTMTIGVDGTGVAVANAVFFDNNKYGVSPGAGAVKNLTNADGNIVQNFYATIGGGAGFVIQHLVIATILLQPMRWEANIWWHLVPPAPAPVSSLAGGRNRPSVAETGSHPVTRWGAKSLARVNHAGVVHVVARAINAPPALAGLKPPPRCASTR
jgi:hypothetical protein